jgi:peptide/nickel transport system substrate-binding protein
MRPSGSARHGKDPHRLTFRRYSYQSGNAYVVGTTESAVPSFPPKVGPDVTFNGTRTGDRGGVDKQTTTADYRPREDLTMGATDEHPLVPTLKRQLVERQIERREFLRYATLLGMAAPTAYAFVARVTGEKLIAPAEAQGALPKGGTLRLAMRCQDLKSPHTYSWIESANSARQVLDYLTVTGVDNITRPSLVEKWEPSPDLKTWTLRLRKTVKWHNGRQFTADDVVWNLKRVLDPKTGSSVVGLMKGFLLEDVETGEKDDKGNPKKSSRLWDANAIQKVDDFTVRLNGKSAQLAVPEQLFHYPLLILDPAENGEFKVGSNGTGAFTLTANEVGRKQVLKARKEGYWGGGPYLDQIEFIDLGDDPAASVSALASKQVDGLYGADIVQLEALQKIPHVQMYQVATAYTATARMQPVKPFDDKRVRQAMRYAIDSNAVLQIAHRGLGQPGEHHHVSAVHPEYAKLAPLQRDVARAKKLLAEAGYPNGIDVEIVCRPQPAWELLAVQTMVEQWKEAGIRVKINVMPSTQYWEVWTKVPFGFTTWAHRPLGIMSLALAYRSGGSWNESKYSNPEFDRLLNQAEGTIDVASRRETMARLEAILQDDGPIVQPVWRAIFTFLDKRVQGFRLHPTLYIFGHQLAIQA